MGLMVFVLGKKKESERNGCVHSVIEKLLKEHFSEWFFKALVLRNPTFLP